MESLAHKGEPVTSGPTNAADEAWQSLLPLLLRKGFLKLGATRLMRQIQVPFFRPNISEAEVVEVVDTLRSGWLTTGPKVRRFEADFAAAVGAPYAVAVNSCTSALHLAVEALGSGPGQAVLVPTMTFAATAEVVRYQGAVPILVDCDPATGNMDLDDAARKCEQLRSGRLTPRPASSPRRAGRSSGWR